VDPRAHVDIMGKRKISCPNRDSNSGSDIWVEKIYNEELCNVKSSPDTKGDLMKDEVGGPCRTHCEGEKGEQSFCWKSCR
jgi:hypothetical protein